MKKYSSLIRKLVDAVTESEALNYDVAEILKNRCFFETSLIRQTLMNAVCDPRFKLSASYNKSWKDNAKEDLFSLADMLESIPDLSKEIAESKLDSFLTDLLLRIVKNNPRPTIKDVNYFKVEKKTENADSALLFMDSLMNPEGEQTPNTLDKIDSASNPLNEDNEDKETDDNKPSSENNVQNLGKGISIPLNVDNEDNEADNDKYSSENNIQNSGKGINKGKEEQKRLEERFLLRIPPSLCALAKRIGRMGINDIYKQGKFLKAGKSDIAGVSVGNDLSAILPSELALLADNNTQSVFYHNYVTNHLQLFASASQVKSDKKHQEGPVIICLDTSSSMNGEPIRIAKALTIAVAIISWRKKREVLVIKYSSTYEYYNFGHSHKQLNALWDYLSILTVGGNNEEEMLQWFFKTIKPTLPEYESADILFVTDAGWCALSNDICDMIHEEKENGMVFYGLIVKNICHEEKHGILNLGPIGICDSLWSYSYGICSEIKGLGNRVKRK